MERKESMSDTEPVVVAERSASGAFIAAVVIAVLFAVGGLVWCYSLQNHIAATDAKLADADKKNATLADQLGSDPGAVERHHRDVEPERRRHPEAD